jgi:mycofactocin precursor peptide peptidase
MKHGDGADLGTMTWPTLWRAAPRPVLVVPVGSCEQHGPHLPLDTDTRIAMALAEGLVDAFDTGGDGARSIVVAPPLTVTASGEHGGFPGTLSIGTEVFERVVVELVRSADWSGGVVLVNGHGGNAAAVGRAVATLRGEGRRVLSWWPRDPGGDAHAGATETSVMLAVAPHLVRRGAVRPGRLEPISTYADELRRDGVRAVSETGVLGDPTTATAAHGRSLLTRWHIDLVAAVDEWWS